jgi:short/branched chain acyl-CoA dehydrogenase
MDFSLSAETVALQKMCADFAAAEIEPYAHEWSEKGIVPVDTYRKMGDLGLMGMLIDPEYGGAGATYVDYVTAMLEIGRVDQSVASAWNAHSTIASLPLAKFGTEEQKQKWLRPLAEGQKIGAFGLTEPSAGSDASGVRTRAEKADGGWVINGTKMFITNAGTEMSLGVTLLTTTGVDDSGKKRFGVFFVPDGTEGYSKSEKLQKLGWKAMDTRELIFDDVFVPDENLIGEEGAGLKAFLDVLEGGRISVAALSLSLAQAALDMAIVAADDREQFGRPIKKFQAISHKIADMATEIEAARALVYRAAWLADTGQPFGKAAAMAKLYASEVANRAASDSLQIHGGYGYIRESRISRFYADAKILEIGEGTSEIQRNVIARYLV